MFQISYNLILSDYFSDYTKHSPLFSLIVVEYFIKQQILYNIHLAPSIYSFKFLSNSKIWVWLNLFTSPFRRAFSFTNTKTEVCIEHKDSISLNKMLYKDPHELKGSLDDPSNGPFMQWKGRFRNKATLLKIRIVLKSPAHMKSFHSPSSWIPFCILQYANIIKKQLRTINTSCFTNLKLIKNFAETNPWTRIFRQQTSRTYFQVIHVASCEFCVLCLAWIATPAISGHPSGNSFVVVVVVLVIVLIVDSRHHVNLKWKFNYGKTNWKNLPHLQS